MCDVTFPQFQSLDIVSKDYSAKPPAKAASGATCLRELKKGIEMRIKKCLLGLAAVTAAFALTGCGTTTDGSSVSRAASSSSNIQRSIPSSNASVSSEVRFEAYVTGYSFWDNTPPGSSAIAHPVIHRRAGGTGTYVDPVTLAVGHKIIGERRSIDYPVGTRFYIKSLRKYAIVEDVCGDGNRPQDGPCHTGKQGRPWLDIYVDGANSARQHSNNCMSRLTRFHTVIQNPGPNYPVVAGPITESGCQVFSS